MLKNIIPNIVLWVTVTTIVSCSYAADYIEGAMTNRASFSISAQYVSGIGVIVEWNYDPDQESFAGYEIYITEEPDNEFSPLIIVGARDNFSSSPYFKSDTTLGKIHTDQFTHDSTPAAGTYFYRVAVIAWDERDYDDDGDDDKSPSTYNKSDYEHYTNIDKISGSAMVEIE
ncbi:MAG: hypothetical protein ACUVRK_07340 [Spirochaetota bacterium]